MDPVSLGKSLLILGGVIALIGLVVMAGGHLPIGRLPGDFHWKRNGVDVYFPLATSILVSVVLTLVLRLFRR
jgi:hypothetical protein